jgi:hypothetical protein
MSMPKTMPRRGARLLQRSTGFQPVGPAGILPVEGGPRYALPPFPPAGRMPANPTGWKPVLRCGSRALRVSIGSAVKRA